MRFLATNNTRSVQEANAVLLKLRHTFLQSHTSNFSPGISRSRSMSNRLSDSPPSFSTETNESLLSKTRRTGCLSIRMGSLPLPLMLHIQDIVSVLCTILQRGRRLTFNIKQQDYAVHTRLFRPGVSPPPNAVLSLPVCVFYTFLLCDESWFSAAGSMWASLQPAPHYTCYMIRVFNMISLCAKYKPGDTYKLMMR